MKVSKLASLFILTLLPVASILATAQRPDKILYEGKEYMLQSNPMEEYFKLHPKMRPKTDVRSSNMWRGYVATFEIKDGSLVLRDIEVQVYNNEPDNDGFRLGMKSALKEVVPDGKPLKIDWFTGLLVLPEGDVVNYVHMGYGSTYERYTLLEIASGDFKKAKKFDHKEYEKFKERQYEEFKKTEEYKKLAKEMKKESRNQEFIDSFLKSFIINYTSKILVD